MHFDSSLRRLSCLAVLALLAGTIAQGLLIPPEVAQEDLDALQHYNELIEALHGESGGFHQRFKALTIQQEAGDLQQVSYHDEDDNLDQDKKKGDKKEPKHGDGDDNDGGYPKLVPVVLGVMSK